MKFETTDFYAALIHEMKNNLGLLAMTIDQIPMVGEVTHDEAVDAARLLCLGVTGRLQAASYIYKANQHDMTAAIDAYSPHDLVREIHAQAKALSRGHFEIESSLDSDVPAIWFFDRDLVEMALINAIHNSLTYAQSRIWIEVHQVNDCLELVVRDDSAGYPDHVLESVALGTPYRSVGTGLGLQFAKMIAQMHENQGRTGSLRLYNDQGAVFSLQLP